MKKVIVFSVFVLAFCLAGTSFAEKICLQDNFGLFWELKGGKIDKKSYTFKRIGLGTCSGHAEVTLLDSGSLILGALSNHGDIGSCAPILWSETVDSTFTGNGTYDYSADGSVDGPVTLTRISCSSLPPL